MKKWLYCILISAHVMSGLAAAIVFRPFFADGMVFFQFLLEGHGFGYDGRYMRHIYYFMQLPTALIARYMTSLPDWNFWAACTYVASYGLHPYVSLFGCYLILRKYKKAEYMVFPLLSHGLISTSLMLYPSLTIQETISVFWPLFLWIVVGNFKNILEVLGIVFLSVVLAMGYESGIVLFAVNIAVLISRRKYNILLLAQLAAIGWLIFRLLGPNAGPNSSFMEALQMSSLFIGFRVFSVIGTLGLVVVARWPQRRWLFLLIVASTAGLAWGLQAWDKPGVLMSQAGLDRTRAAPLVSIIALLAFWMFNKRRPLPLMHFFCIFTLACSLVYDIYTTYHFARGMTAIKKLYNENPGCNVIDRQDVENVLNTGYGIADWWMPVLSTQLHKTLKPTSIIFPESPITGEHCRVKNGRLGMEGPGEITLPVAGTVDLRPLAEGPIHALNWNPTTKTWDKRPLAR